MLFITIFRNVYSLLLYARQNRINAIYDTSFRFFTGISLYHWNYDLFKHIGIFFSFFFKHFTSFYKFNTNFYVLSNSSLTASFISKYIAVQLVRGQDVRDILATLRLEFNQIRDYTSEPFPMHYIKRLIIYKTYRNSIKKKKFKKFTVNLIYFSNRQNRNYFQSTKT